VPVLKVSKVDERPAARPTSRATSPHWRALHSVVGGRADERRLPATSAHRAGRRGGFAAPRRQHLTIVKLRAIARQQQLLRIDFETPPSHEVLQASWPISMPSCRWPMW